MTGCRFLPAALLFALGCGSSGDAPKRVDMGGEDGAKIAVLIEDLNDAKGNAKKIEAAFTRGAKPADAKKFAQCSYYVSRKPNVSGTGVTCKVRVEGANGNSLGEPGVCLHIAKAEESKGRRCDGLEQYNGDEWGQHERREQPLLTLFQRRKLSQYGEQPSRRLGLRMVPIPGLFRSPEHPRWEAADRRV